MLGVAMSNEVHSLCKKRKVGTATLKAVLLYMADAASDDGSGIWTSKANMARDLEVSKRAVQLSIQSLIERGLCFESGQRKCANGFTHEYSLNLEVLAGLPSTREKPVDNLPQVNPIHPTGEPHSRVGVNPIHPTGEPHSPKPSLNHPIEPSNEPSLFPDIVQKQNTENMEDQFIEFWKAYPKPDDKQRTRKLYYALMRSKEISHQDLMLRLEAYKQSDTVQRGFIRNSGTWLSKRTWENIETAPIKSATSEVEHLLKLADIEDAMGNPHEARRYRAEAKAKGWAG